MRSQTLFWGILLLANCVACTDNGSSDDDSSPGGSAGQTTGGASGSGGTATGGAGTGGAAGTASGGKGGSSGGSAGNAGSGPLLGVCGQRAEAVVTPTTFDGFEEFYIIGEEGFGTDICVVRFDLTRVGEPPPGCVDAESQPCMWAHQVAYGNPMVVLDEDGVCANSDLGLDNAGMAAIVGTEASYGYVFEYQGHPSVVMKLDPELDSWITFGLAGYDEETGDFSFDHRDGVCNYSLPP